MPLSEYEQRVLEQMERQLGADDPKLASSLGEGTRQTRVGRYIAGAFGVLLGIVLLLVGVSTQIPVIGILGFLAMLLGVIWAVSSPRAKGPKGVVDPSTSTVKPRKGPAKKSGSSSGGMMDRFEERWDKRRRDRGL